MRRGYLLHELSRLKFQSTHPLRGATVKEADDFCSYGISIHAPLAGCDFRRACKNDWWCISIHAPLAGCDWNRGRSCPQGRIFQSTHPLRGATKWQRKAKTGGRDFNPRTPCGVRRCETIKVFKIFRFQSTHPLRGATQSKENQVEQRKFQSTHPLRGATETIRIIISARLFQSTHPLRGATAKLPKYSRQICAKATKFLQSQTKSGVVACWAKGKRPLFPALRGANLPGKTGTLPVRIR